MAGPVCSLKVLFVQTDLLEQLITTWKTFKRLGKGHRSVAWPQESCQTCQWALGVNVSLGCSGKCIFPLKWHLAVQLLQSKDNPQVQCHVPLCEQQQSYPSHRGLKRSLRYERKSASHGIASPHAFCQWMTSISGAVYAPRCSKNL